MTVQYKIVRFNTGKYGVQVSGGGIEGDNEYYLNDGRFVSYSRIPCFKEWNESIQLNNVHLCKDLIDRHKKQLEEAKLVVEEILEIVE